MHDSIVGCYDFKVIQLNFTKIIFFVYHAYHENGVERKF